MPWAWCSQTATSSARDRVLSNADPKTTFLDLVPESELPDRFLATVRAYRCEGTSMKINLAVDALPRATAIGARGVQPYHRGIVEVNPMGGADGRRPGGSSRRAAGCRSPHRALRADGA